MKMSNVVLNFVKYFSHLLWPQSCPACGAVGVSFCEDCLAGTAERIPPFCVDCGGLYGVPCCDGSIPCYALTQHDGLSREFLIRFKYRGARALGAAMGALMARSFEAPEADLIVPVPLHAGSRRPYNQSELIARAMSEIWGIPLDADCVRWRRGVGRQMGRGMHERRAIPIDALHVRRDLEGATVVLVDDVYTTGGTLRSVRRALEQKGARVTCAYVWARRFRTSEYARSRPGM